MTAATIGLAIVFSLLGLLAVATVLFGLPGGWIMLGLAVVIELSDGWLLGLVGVPVTDAPVVTFGWWVIGVGVVLALAGEALELVSGMVGAKTGGSTRGGTIGSFVGGLLGALAGTFLIPIPVFGTLIGALVGTFVGAIVGEITGYERKELKDAVKPALTATIGRAIGLVAKTGVALALWAGLTVAAIWP